LFVGRALYLLGIAFVSFSVLAIIFGIFAGGLGNMMIPIFALLNGLIAMGVGD
jgi:hypothetical protein